MRRRAVLGLGAGAGGTLLATAAVGVATGALAPAAAAASAGLALAGLTATAWRATAEPGLFGPVFGRGRHPGRLALVVEGPDPERLAPLLRALGEVRVTVFVAAPAPDLAAAGHEVGLLAGWGTLLAGGALAAAAARVGARRWVRGPQGRGGPGLAGAADRAGLRPVAHTVRLAGRGAASAAARAVATDVVHLLPDRAVIDALPGILAEWESRAIRPGPLADALAEDGHDHGSDTG